MFLSTVAAVQVVNKEHSLDFLSITDKFRIFNEKCESVNVDRSRVALRRADDANGVN